MYSLLGNGLWRNRGIVRQWVALCGTAAFSTGGYADIMDVAESIDPGYFLKAEVRVPDRPSLPYQVLLVQVPVVNWPWAEGLRLTLLDDTGSQLYAGDMFLDRGIWRSILSTSDRSASVYGDRELPLVLMPFLTNPDLTGTLIIQTTPALTEDSLPPENLLVQAAKQAGETTLFWNADYRTELTGMAIIPEPSAVAWAVSLLTVLGTLVSRRRTGG